MYTIPKPLNDQDRANAITVTGYDLLGMFVQSERVGQAMQMAAIGDV